MYTDAGIMENKELVTTLSSDLTTKSPTITRKTHSHPGAYAFLHNSSQQAYVGSTENIYARVNSHKNDLLNNRHKNRNLQEAFNADPSFTLFVQKTDTVEEAIDKEQKLLDVLLPGGKLLNISPDARVPCKGVVKTDEQKQLLSEITKKQFSSQEARQKQSEAAKRQWEKPGYRENLKPVTHTPEVLKTFSENLTNRWKDDEYRKFMSEVRIVGVVVNGVEYPSVEDAANALNKTKASIWYQVNSKREKHANTFTFKRNSNELDDQKR